MTLEVTADNCSKTFNISFTAGERTTQDPTGPDDYAYWAYDMTDTLYTECPTYNWQELDPGYGGNGTHLVLANDETKQLDLPFTFKYYGHDYNTISVCSNGWVVAGVTSDTTPRFYPIPDTGGPGLCVAVFWGDLDPSQAGGVYYKYDSSLHSFIVEWSRVFHKVSGNEETFEVLFSDPAYNPTVTGDGEIFCQYYDLHKVNNSATGIEDSTETIGLAYQVGGVHSAGSAPLVNNFVLKFTTDPPEYVGVSEGIGANIYPEVYGLSRNEPNPFSGGTVIRYQIPRGKEVGVSLRVYDVSGKLVRVLVDARQDAGFYNVRWDGKDMHNRVVSSGVYFIRLSAGRYTKTGKMLLVR